MAWEVMWQEQGTKRVKVRRINRRPVTCKKTGRITGYAPLGFVVLQAVVKHHLGGTVRVKVSLKHADHPKFTVQQPDTQAHPLMRVGRPGNSRLVPDALAAPVVVPGQKDEFHTVNSFMNYMNNRMGPAVTEEVLGLFAGVLAHMV